MAYLIKIKNPKKDTYRIDANNKEQALHFFEEQDLIVNHVKEDDSYALPQITDEDLDSYKQKADDYENETKQYKITPQERLELARQLQDLGVIRGQKGLVGLNNGLRVNRGKTNYDIFYDSGKDSYVVYKLTQKGFTDFTKEKFDDVYVEDLKEIIK